MENEPERQRGFDGEIGILPLPATHANAHGLPGGDRIRGQPHGDITSLDQRSIVCRPISDVVFCLVFWVHSRLHVEIMRLPSLQWPGCRAWLTEGAGSVHQRPARALVSWRTTWNPGEVADVRGPSTTVCARDTGDDRIVSGRVSPDHARPDGTTGADPGLLGRGGCCRLHKRLRCQGILKVRLEPTQQLHDLIDEILKSGLI